MEIAKLTTKGQLTLPITIRRQMGLDAGDKIAFMEKDGEIMLINIDRISVGSPKNYNANIQNVIASMKIEGLVVEDESVRYMHDRLEGKITVEDRVAQIRRKYSKA